MDAFIPHGSEGGGDGGDDDDDVVDTATRSRSGAGETEA